MVRRTGGSWIHEYAGLAADEKPVEDVPNGSTFIEMDTGKVFMFDAENSLWVEL